MFTRWKLAPNTVTQRLAALRFFYIQVLKRGWNAAETPYPKKVLHLPHVLSQEEVARLIDAAEMPFHRILLMTLYATGARRAEVAHLKVSDIDSQRMVVPIRGGKGRKDRDVMLSRRCWMRCASTGAASDASRPTGCFPATDGIRRVILSPPRCSGPPVRRRPNAQALSTSTSIPTPCVIVSPRICLRPEPTLRTIQMLLGHRDLEETTIYLHLSHRHLSATASPLDALTLTAPGEQRRSA